MKINESTEENKSKHLFCDKLHSGVHLDKHVCRQHRILQRKGRKIYNNSDFYSKMNEHCSEAIEKFLFEIFWIFHAPTRAV